MRRVQECCPCCLVLKFQDNRKKWTFPKLSRQVSSQAIVHSSCHLELIHYFKLILIDKVEIIKINCKLFPGSRCVRRTKCSSLGDWYYLAGSALWASLYSLQSFSAQGSKTRILEVIIRTRNGQIIEKLKLEIVRWYDPLWPRPTRTSCWLIINHIWGAQTAESTNNNSSDYYKCVSKCGHTDL